ncbi:hypothetical protein [Niallia oryzisoli]|uniref:hypothetical protein n=1 Tax=Niallia oryzisoli TaxID=1737571 RepID=UPI003736D317
MRSNRKVNKYPYIILGILHFVMLLFTFYKSKERKNHLVLLLSFTGFAYLFEYIVVALFDGYEYKPKFLKEKQLDNIFGSVLSQFFYVPTTALFITAFQLGWKVKLFFSLFFTLIERLFITLGVFKNKWWKTPYTFGLIFISFIFNDIWYNAIQKRNSYILFFSFYHLIQVTWHNMVYIFAVMRKFRFGKGLIFSWKENFIISPLIGILVSLILTWWLQKENTLAKINSLLLMMLVDLSLLNKRMLKVKSLLIFPVKYFIIMFSAYHYRKWVYGDGSAASKSCSRL